MEESLEIDVLRIEFQMLREQLGTRTWKEIVRQVDPYYQSGQGLLDMNAVRDNQANYSRTLRLLRAMRKAITGRTIQSTIRKQGLTHSVPKSLQDKYPAAHRAARKRASHQKNANRSVQSSTDEP